MTDYGKAIENAVFNWERAKTEISVRTVYNAVRMAIDNDFYVHVPVYDSSYIDERQRKIEPVFLEDTDGNGWIPVFTSTYELKKGNSDNTECLSLKELAEFSMELAEPFAGLVFNVHGKAFRMDKADYELIMEEKPESVISYLNGSVVKMHVDAIVNAAKASLAGGGGIDGAIHKAAGPGLAKECAALGSCNTGEVKISGAHNIKNAEHIIHAVGPVYHGNSNDAVLLASCYEKSLDLALKNGCTSIAFPCISTGIFGYPLKDATCVALRTVGAWLNKHKNVVMNVYFCCFTQNEFACYEEVTDEMYNVVSLL